jgi:hypothetical protein
MRQANVPRDSRRGLERQRAVAFGLPLNALLLALLIALPAAAAESGPLEVSASLRITGGVARAGAYAPVNLYVSNLSGTPIAQLTVDSGGPVVTWTAVRIDPGATAGLVLPVYVTPGGLAITVYADAIDGRTFGPATADMATDLPPLAPQTPLWALVGPVAGDPPAGREGDPRRFLRVADAAALWPILRCGLLDGVSLPAGPPPTVLPVAVTVREGGAERPVWTPPFGAGARTLVQPHTVRLMADEPWPASERRGLWMALAAVGLVALALAAAAPRRFRRLAALAIALAGVAAAGILWQWGGLARAQVTEARVFTFRIGQDWAALEHLTLLESRGGVTARAAAPRAAGGMDRDAPALLPLPVAAASDDLFRTLAVLEDGRIPLIETDEPQALLHTLLVSPHPFDYAPADVSAAELARLAARPDVVRALLIRGTQAEDAAGESRPVEAWAVAWRADADAAVAWAGRSLAWWDRHRREGDGPLLVAWWRDAADSGEGLTPLARRPALVVVLPAE